MLFPRRFNVEYTWCVCGVTTLDCSCRAHKVLHHPYPPLLSPPSLIKSNFHFHQFTPFIIIIDFLKYYQPPANRTIVTLKRRWSSIFISAASTLILGWKWKLSDVYFSMSFQRWNKVVFSTLIYDYHNFTSIVSCQSKFNGINCRDQTLQIFQI